MRPLLLIPLAAAAAVAAPALAQDRVVICHATGDPDSPYVELTLANEDAFEHTGHEDDLVPAPPGGCPATEVVLEEDPPSEAPTATPSPTATAAPRSTPSPQRAGRRDREGGRQRERDDDDGGGATSGGGASGHAAPPAVQTVDTRRLPMTGGEIWLIGAAGVGFLLTGTGIRLVSPAAGRPPGPSGR